MGKILANDIHFTKFAKVPLPEFCVIRYKINSLYTLIITHIYLHVSEGCVEKVPGLFLLLDEQMFGYEIVTT